jgi:hypothetical protein
LSLSTTLPTPSLKAALKRNIRGTVGIEISGCCDGRSPLIRTQVTEARVDDRAVGPGNQVDGTQTLAMWSIAIVAGSNDDIRNPVPVEIRDAGDRFSEVTGPYVPSLVSPSARCEKHFDFSAAVFTWPSPR